MHAWVFPEAHLHFQFRLGFCMTPIVFLQLQCNKGDIRAHIGGEFILICTYDTNRFLYSKKYWCRGDSKNTCEILVDSESAAKTKNTHRTQIIDARRRGLFVKVTNLQFDDSGVYWVGIDKIYADIMTSVSVVVTQGKNKADSYNA
uniref:Immunoglobulin V-set domain-containing protein n=1 Tax=Acanthochromis polyacanthus TaxID=80966 RepID=A0A3Q1FML1_9TELE